MQLFGTLCDSLLFDVVGARRQHSDVTNWNVSDAGINLAASATRIHETSCIEASTVDEWCHPANNGTPDHCDNGVVSWWRHCPGMAATSVGHVALTLLRLDRKTCGVDDDDHDDDDDDDDHDHAAADIYDGNGDCYGDGMDDG